MNVGNRIYTQIERTEPRIIEMFRGIPSSNINDEINRLYNFHAYMHLLNPEKFSGSMVGPALTVKCPAGDNLFFHQALDLAQPGDIVVLDADGCANRSVGGEIMMRFACKKGIAGIVVDGYMRDLDGIKALPMPVYARGVTPQGPYKNGPGEINVPIACGGQVVFPGDVIVGDMDGLVVVRRQDAEELAQIARAKKEKEEKSFEKMEKDFDAYCEGHKNTTAKRMEGKNPQFIDSSFVKDYHL